MKIATLAFVTSFAMVGVGGAVFAVTPEGGFGKWHGAASARAEGEGSPASSGSAQATAAGSAGAPDATKLARFKASGAFDIEGRVGSAALRADNPAETFVMLELTGRTSDEASTATDKPVRQTPRVSLSLVIDKSGSMRGSRLANALSAAVSAVEQLHDGDTVSVIAFDTKTQIVVPQTEIQSSGDLGTRAGEIQAARRASVIQAIRGIQLGGDTCISCGIDGGLNELRKSTTLASSTNVERMLLLSDGEATAGVREPDQFKTIAQQAMTQGVTISTIGVDVDYNERIMTAIAVGSNGRHYFVERDTDLGRVFEAEAQALTESVAANATANIDLAPGVELVQLYDRSFTRSGSKLSVSLGSLGKGETKTVLFKVRLRGGEPGPTELADVNVSFRDLATGQDATESGKLGVDLVSADATLPEVDGVVLDRVQRSETAAALLDANSLFSVGKVDEARKRLEKAQQHLSLNKAKADRSVDGHKAAAVDKSFDDQSNELNRASNGFAEAPAPAAGMPAPKPAEVQRDQKANARQNASKSVDFGF